MKKRRRKKEEGKEGRKIKIMNNFIKHGLKLRRMFFYVWLIP
jgi:hypothetical protein